MITHASRMRVVVYWQSRSRSAARNCYPAMASHYFGETPTSAA